MPASSQKTMLRKQLGNRNKFLVTYSPDYQLKVCGSPTLCVVGDYPTLTDIKLAYGENASAAWLVPQLLNLSEYCGCKDKLQGKPLEECAHIISMEYGYLKISELMLFFYWFKSGKFGRFYGSVDPLVITTSLREFMKERAKVIDRYEQEQREKAEEESRKNKISWEEYCKQNGRPVDVHPLMRKVETKKQEPAEDVEQGIRSAEGILSEYNLSESSRKLMSNMFKKKYGCEPQEYINKHKK